MMTAICAYTTPILRYTFGIMKWSLAELRKLDVKTRKLLTLHDFHHPKLSIPHLYLHCLHGRRGLTGVETTHDCKCSALVKYILENTDALMQIVQDTPTSTQEFLMKLALCPKHTIPNAVDNGHHQALLAKTMHGRLFIQQEEVPGVDLAQSHMWLHQAGLHGEPEAALFTTQDQAMATNYVCHEIYKQSANLLCCLCDKHNKTIFHIDNGCDMFRGTKYVEHNDKCQHKADKTSSICFDAGHTLMYNMTQRFNHAISANRLDLVLLDELKKTALIIHVTCPMDINTVTAAAKKHKNNHDLKIAMMKQHKCCKTQTVPI
eukprot:1911743-Ditylum_brightwellii.AAC.1